MLAPITLAERLAVENVVLSDFPELLSLQFRGRHVYARILDGMGNERTVNVDSVDSILSPGWTR